MTRKEQIKILEDKTEANKRQYDLDRTNAEILAYSSGDLPKYEYLTKKDLGYKPDAVEIVKFEYSPLGKVFTDGLDKSDKKVGIFQRLKNIEDNLNSNDDDNDNDNGKVGVFQIIKDIKDKGIKISNDDEAIKEIRDHIQNLKDEAIDINFNNDQVNNLVYKILKGIGKRDSTLKDSASEDSASEDLASEDLSLKNLEIKSFLSKYEEPIETFYSSDIFGKRKIDTKEINNALANKKITENEFW